MSLGEGQVVKDVFTGQPRFALVYHQVYAHNPEQIVAGRLSWAAYMGSTDRGWMYTRPVSDALVKLPALTESYTWIDGEVFSPLDSLQEAFEVMQARYRSGDGTGVSMVTPYASCSQDTAQGLFVAGRRMQDRINQAQSASEAFGFSLSSSDRKRFRRLRSVVQDYEQFVLSGAFTRWDWRNHIGTLAIQGNEVSDRIEAISWQDPGQVGGLINMLISLRFAVPRWAFDDLAEVMLRNGGRLQLLNSYQIGGSRQAIYPLGAGFESDFKADADR